MAEFLAKGSNWPNGVRGGVIRALNRGGAALKRLAVSLEPQIPGGKVRARRGSLWFDLYPAEFYVDREIFLYGDFEHASISLWRKALKPGAKVVDVGANFGYYTLISARLVGEPGHVWAVEPTPKFRSRLKEHVSLLWLLSSPGSNVLLCHAGNQLSCGAGVREKEISANCWWKLALSIPVRLFCEDK